ncbi:hypothetical protein RDI58_020738 [Solanum bulbocastanum]|uniref:Uncharacterized protein n=1 Tax=Solanum bulbocastanum TaxID=147425 RepID=A0AAN8TD10_SOLBU
MVGIETISAMESKIAYLNAELAAVAEKEKKRGGDYDNKIGNILSPCPTSSDGYDQEGDENDKSDKESDQGDEE